MRSLIRYLERSWMVKAKPLDATLQEKIDEIDTKIKKASEELPKLVANEKRASEENIEKYEARKVDLISGCSYRSSEIALGSLTWQVERKMPVPVEYQRATDAFYKFLDDARDNSDLTTTNQAYTMVQGVLQAFRRRLELKEAIRFAGVLPAATRALFVADWNVDEPKRPFEDRAIMTKEVQSLRSGHNFSPDSAIHDVAAALRQNIDEIAFDQVLAGLPQGAQHFWRCSRS